MQFPDHIFRAYDIRGRTPEELNPNVSYALGWSLAKTAQAKGLFVWHLGFDGRRSSPTLANAMAQGMHNAGSSVRWLGLCPTPLLYFATMRHADQCGAMITGSHNPPADNGCKMTIGGISLAKKEITNLQQMMQDVEMPPKESISHFHHHCLDLSNDYIAEIIAKCTLHKPMRVVVDCGNGVAGVIMPRLLDALGCEVIALYCDVDGDFPHHHPDPGKLENLCDLQHKVITTKADIGIAFDGDGDRLGIVTNTGRVVFPDRAFMLFADDLLSRVANAKILLDVKCSPLAVRYIQSKGGEAILSATGHSLIKRAMRKHEALLAGEMSGHLFFGEKWNGCDDAPLGAAKLLSILSTHNASADEVFARYPHWVGTPEINLYTSEQRKWEIITQLQQSIPPPNAKKITIDGLRIECNDCWGLARASNTTPTIVLRFEGENTCALQKIQTMFYQQLQAIAPELDMHALEHVSP